MNDETLHLIESHKSWTTFVYDAQLNVVEVINPHKELLLLKDTDTLKGKNINQFLSIYHGENALDLNLIVENLKKVADNGKPRYFEYSVEDDANGVSIVLCYTEKRKNGYIYSNILPLDRKVVYKGRKAFNIKVASQSLDYLPVAVWIRWMDGKGSSKYLYFNSAVKNYFGCEDPTHSIYWNQNRADKYDNETFNSSETVVKEYSLVDADGTTRMWVELHKHRVENLAGGYNIITTAMDVSEYKRAKIELEKQYSIIKAMYETLPFGLVGFDNLGRIHSINEQALRLFGVKDAALTIGNSFFDDPNVPDDVKRRVLNGEDVEYMMDYNFKKACNVWGFIQKDGRRFIKSRVLSIYDSTKTERMGYILVCEDKTEEFKKERALKEANARVSGLFNSIKSGIVVYGNDYNVIECNDEAISLLGIINKEKVGNQQLDFQLEPNFSSEVINIIKNNDESVQYVDYDFDLSRKRGFLISDKRGKATFEIRTSKLFAKDGEVLGVIMLFNDVTEKFRREKELMELNTSFKSLMSVSKVVIWRYSLEDDLYENILGQIYGPEVCNLASALKMIDEDDRGPYEDSFNKLFKGESSLEKGYYRIYAPDKKQWVILWIEMTMLTDAKSGKIYIFATQKDVTEDERIRRDLEQFQIRTKLTNELNNIVQWNYDIKTKKFTILGSNEQHASLSFTFDQYMNTIKPEDREKVSVIGETIVKKKTESVTVIARAKVMGRDDYRFVRLSCLPVFNAKGVIESYTGIRQDVTEMMVHKQKLEEYKKRIELSGNAADIIQWEYDVRDGNIHISSGKTFITGNNLPMKDYLKLVHPDDVAELTSKVMRMTDGELPDKECMMEFRIKLPDATEYRIFKLSGVKICDSASECTKYIGFMMDVTAWARQNEELRKAKLKAEESDHLKSAFLANMSHEIRTPLNAIVGFSDLLANTDDFDEKQLYRGIIVNNSELLLNLIGDILDLSKIEAGTIDIISKEFDMADCFDCVYKTFELKMTNPEVILHSINPYKKCIVNLDSNRVRQIYTNFLTNAIKYTPSGSIEMTYETVDGGLKLIVKDTGIGIAEDKYDKVFQRFEKLDCFAQGSGLGLSICQAIIDKCNGKIGFESELGKGSTFWAWFPTHSEIE